MAEDIAKERMRVSVKCHIHVIDLNHHLCQRLVGTGLLHLLYTIGRIGTSSELFLVRILLILMLTIICYVDQALR